MRRQNLSNKTVIKAITIGLAAVMATAQPMMVLAADDPADGGTPAAGSVELKDVKDGVADDAQGAANDASAAIGVNDPAVKTDDTKASKACDDAAGTILADFDAGEAKAITSAVNSDSEETKKASDREAKKPSNEADVKNAAEELVKDTTLEIAAGYVEVIKTDLIEAENAVVASNKVAPDVVDSD